MIFFTFNDLPSGIYESQVINVCQFIQSTCNIQVKLIAFIPYKKYFSNRRKILSQYKNTLIFPIIPVMKWWKINMLSVFLYFFFRKEKTVIARGVFAAYFAYQLREKGVVNKLVYDGRGAFSAELAEYKIITNEKLKKELKHAEEIAVNESDFRIAVSGTLVNYWKKEFNYVSDKHVIIPCTLYDSNTIFPSEDEILNTRKKLGFEKDDIVFVYAGSSAGWQSFELIDSLFYDLLKGNRKIKVLFLTNGIINNLKIVKDFSESVIQKWLPPSKVYPVLCACDYGILLRKNSVTNMVASPTKFAEYLRGGLRVLISEQIGDFTTFVKNSNCGIVVTDNLLASSFIKPVYEEKMILHRLAIEKFSKKAFKNEYRSILAATAIH